MAGKNWQLFLKDRGISLQEIGNESVCNGMKLKVRWILTKFYKHQLKMAETNQESRRYPPEMDAFASEGFLQFF